MCSFVVVQKRNELNLSLVRPTKMRFHFSSDIFSGVGYVQWKILKYKKRREAKKHKDNKKHTEK